MLKTFMKTSVVMVIVLVAGCDKREQGGDMNLPTLSPPQLQAEDVAYEAWQVLLTYLEKAGDDSYAITVRKLPGHWRVVYTTFWLECEVDNGGHHQFFWNSKGLLNKETLADLKHIGAVPFVKIFTGALDVYNQHNYDQEKDASGNTWEGFTQGYIDKRMGELDKRFFSQKKTVVEYLSDHILKHRELYMQKSPEQVD